MKRILLSLGLLLTTMAAMAQVPQGINYQAVMRDGAGMLIASQTVALRLSIIQNGNATTVYQETHTTTTNQFGLVNLAIGFGTPVQGSFSAIDWANGPYSAQMEADINGGNAYVLFGSQQLMSVPYALYAEISGQPGTSGATGPTGADGAQGIQGVTGPQGPTGANGLDGATGPQGEQGLTGATGPQGPTGADGAQGLQGVTGQQGPTGADGAQGIQGVTGPQGSTGANGLDGATGPLGEQGLTGATGPQGPTGPTGTVSAGNASGDILYWDGIQWVELPGGQQQQILTFCDGLPAWTVGGLCPGTIGSLNCGSATNSGNLFQGTAASGVSSSIPYTGGNGSPHNGQTTNSTGVTGLTATLPAGSFLNGNSTLTYTITGTPNAAGTASFALSIGGQNCTLTRTVAAPAGSITALNCASATNSGSLTALVAASGVSSSIPYTGGNGGTHSGQTVSSTGVTGLTATLATGSFASGIGSLTYSITGTPSAVGAASFSLNIGGQSCSLTLEVTPVGSITALNCNSATNNGSLTAGTAASGVSSSVPYTGGNGGTHTGQTVTSTGVTGLTATLSAGSFASGSGTLTYTISGTPSASGTSNFSLNIGGQNCTLNRTVFAPVGSITALNCNSATNSGSLIAGMAASGVSSSIPYTGGNGGAHNGQTRTSTGVTGLTATLAAGNFANGSGSLTYTITGTPSASGTASFALDVGGRTCTLTRSVQPLSSQYASGSVFCASGPTVIVAVTNPSSGKIWMDRNLGASRVALSSTDGQSYGDLYQWGRRSDGHQCRTSPTTSTLSSTDQPAHGSFILTSGLPYDWRSPQNTNLWQGVNGVNNPCPSGYRLPTETEWATERSIWSQNGCLTSEQAFCSPLKLPKPGRRFTGDGSLIDVGSIGRYWSRTVSGNQSRYLWLSGGAYEDSQLRGVGSSVRCIKN